MNPTVIAAIVGVGGTAVVGIAGYWANAWSTNKTIAHDLESRVWDRRAEVYVEALAAVHYRQVRRNALAPDTDEAKRTADALLATYQQPDWHKLEARMQAFASEPMITLMQASSNAHVKAVDAHRSWGQEILPANPGDAPATAALWQRAKVRFDTAQVAAEKADDAVVEAIRIELQGRGKPLGDWQPTSEPAQ